MADVRELFYKVSPQFIYQFFIGIRSAPHNLNIFPVDVPDEFMSRYTHAYNLNQLSIQVNAFFVPSPARTNNVQSWWVKSCRRFFFVQFPSYILNGPIVRLRDAVNTTADVLEILAAIVAVYLDYQHNQERTDEENRTHFQGRGHNVRIWNVDVPHWLPELQAVFHQVGAFPTWLFHFEQPKKCNPGLCSPNSNSASG